MRLSLRESRRVGGAELVAPINPVGYRVTKVTNPPRSWRCLTTSIATTVARQRGCKRAGWNSPNWTCCADA